MSGLGGLCILIPAYKLMGKITGVYQGLLRVYKEYFHGADTCVSLKIPCYTQLEWCVYCDHTTAPLCCLCSCGSALDNSIWFKIEHKLAKQWSGEDKFHRCSMKVDQFPWCIAHWLSIPPSGLGEPSTLTHIPQCIYRERFISCQTEAFREWSLKQSQQSCSSHHGLNVHLAHAARHNKHVYHHVLSSQWPKDHMYWISFKLPKKLFIYRFLDIVNILGVWKFLQSFFQE